MLTLSAIVLLVSLEFSVNIKAVNTRLVPWTFPIIQCARWPVFHSEFSICPNIRCKNNGLCAVHNPTGPYEAVCRCRAGTWGEYCHLNGKVFVRVATIERSLPLAGTVGSCSSTVCMNGGACQENLVGSTRYVYCLCEPGFKGTKCDDRTCSRGVLINGGQ